MTLANVNIFEFHDESKANDWISWYNIQGPVGFSEAEILLFVRTGPTSGITVSVYPNEKAREAGSEARNEFKKQQSKYISDITVLEGEVEMKHVKKD
jgi:hypothetical protein